MRTFIIVILLAVAAYYLYTRERGGSGGLPAQIAWRAVTRDQRGAVNLVEVVAVGGNRWRIEVKFPSKPRMLVAVSDGIATAASNPQVSATSLDPRPSMRLLLGDLRRGSPEATEQIAGHPYLRFAQTFNGAPVHVWADPQTRFPYRIRGLDPFTDVTFTPLPAPSAHDTPDLFSVRALTPLLSRYATNQ
ncbi:MAG: hypothetical protein ABI680_11990 [Chthoniobacteraceae bacterium]